jgi:steroid 5-alpha reductase family enzyme
MPPLALWTLNLAVVLGALLVLWLLSLRLRDASIIDLFWGMGFVLVAWLTWAQSEGEPTRGALLVGLTTVWGLRLTAYLTWRNHGRGEDPRYQAMRRAHGDRFGRVSLYSVFGLQGLLIGLVSLPVQMGQLAAVPEAPTALDLAGTALFAVGLFFESVGDWQLARFKSDPANRGRVMDRGLWRYTRHPNYFGDFLVWWGLYLIAAAAGAAWTVVAPLVMSVLLMRVSGVTLLEKSLGARPGYQDYVRRTNAFFPGPPKPR